VIGSIPLASMAWIHDAAVDDRTGRVSFIISTPPTPPQAWVVDATTGMFDQMLGAGRAYPRALCADPSDGRLFLAILAPSTSEGYVQVRDARTGRLLRVAPIGGPTLDVHMAVDEQHSRLVVANAGMYYGPRPTDGSVSILDARTGRRQRQFRVPGMVTAVGVDSRAGHVLVTSDATPQSSGHTWTISTFAMVTGRLLRRVFVPLELGAQRMAVDEHTDRAFVLGTGYRGAVYTIDTRTGRPIHTVRFGVMPSDIAVDAAAGRVFVALPGPMVKRSAYATTSSRTGVGTDAWMPAGPGSIQALDARTGRPMGRAIGVGVAPVALALDQRRRRVLVLNAGSRDTYTILSGKTLRLRAATIAPSSVSVLDEATGRAARMIALDVSIDPTALAFDPVSGHAFVAVSGGVTGVSAPDALGWLPDDLCRRLPFPQAARTTRTVGGQIIHDVDKRLSRCPLPDDVL